MTKWILFLLVVSFSLFAKSVSKNILTQKPKLVLVLVIDQFRADYITRFHSRFLPALDKNNKLGGFKYLMDQGAYYPFAEYEILQNMTGPGHATILSGSYPYRNAIALNNWYDKKLKKLVYCAEDNDPKIGMSPRNFIASTLGDELKNAGLSSKVFSIALKDRASIFMAGHRADGVFWFNPKESKWTSSEFYLSGNKLPHWLNTINDEIKLMKPETWEFKGETSGLTLSKDNANFLSKNIESEYGLNFPHIFSKLDKKLLATPFGLDITEKLAEVVIEKNALGKSKHPDLLAVSFSSHDYVGHLFGPNSLEVEDMTYHEDRLLSKLFNYVNKNVPGGIKNVLIVLTADHGAPPNPNWLLKNRVEAGRLDEKKLQELAEQHLESVFGKADEKWVTHLVEFNYYLSTKNISDKKLEASKVQAELKKFLIENGEGVLTAFTETDYINRKLPPAILEKHILNTYFSGRSGDVISIPKPYFMVGEDTVSHQTDYTYDKTVPLFIAGSAIEKGLYATPAKIVDIAPTIAFLLGTLAPNANEGKVLSEIIK